jgi:hypothetical protein
MDLKNNYDSGYKNKLSVLEETTKNDRKRTIDDSA